MDALRLLEKLGEETNADYEDQPDLPWDPQFFEGEQHLRGVGRGNYRGRRERGGDKPE